ncbi:MAG: AI-2E family transporter [Gammaproteobacteria bacterium PRO9]|nr:AI-2E family transporter [Gammaproteobacteria bacterium PRO9]
MADLQNWTIERIVRLVALVLLALACLQVILPFLGALTWAAIIAITIWPAYMWLSGKLGNRPVVAASLCSLALFVLLVLPFGVLTVNVGQVVPQVAAMLKDLAQSIAPEPPDWAANLPFIGDLIREVWQAAVTDMAGMLKKTLPAAEQAGVWALAQGASLALALMEFLFAILIAGIFLITADRSAELAARLVARLNISEQERIIPIVVGTVRSVSLGLVGTATIQAAISAIGFLIVGMPGVVLLGFATFMVALVQIPTFIIWLPAALWLYYNGETGPAIVLVVWGLVLVTWIDNFMRPYLISRGAKLPFALILMGVLGGLLAWGIIGLFIGPTLLAVAYSLIRTWIGTAREAVNLPPAP